MKQVELRLPDNCSYRVQSEARPNVCKHCGATAGFCPFVTSDTHIVGLYTNHRGETRPRRVALSRGAGSSFLYGYSSFHNGGQRPEWVVHGWDAETGQAREFALSGFMGHSTFQSRVSAWVLECFGSDKQVDGMERVLRFFEEAAELSQACGLQLWQARRLLESVFSKPVGEVFQEVGGVMTTLAALCAPRDLEMYVCAEDELRRVLGKVDEIRAKNLTKVRVDDTPRDWERDPILFGANLVLTVLAESLSQNTFLELEEGEVTPAAVKESVCQLIKSSGMDEWLKPDDPEVDRILAMTEEELTADLKARGGSVEEVLATCDRALDAAVMTVDMVRLLKAKCAYLQSKVAPVHDQSSTGPMRLHGAYVNGDVLDLSFDNDGGLLSWLVLSKDAGRQLRDSLTDLLEVKEVGGRPAFKGERRGQETDAVVVVAGGGGLSLRTIQVRARLGNRVPRHVYLDGDPLFTAATDHQAKEVVDLINEGARRRVSLSTVDEVSTFIEDWLSNWHVQQGGNYSFKDTGLALTKALLSTNLVIKDHSK